MPNELTTFPIGQQVARSGHFTAPIVLEAARLLGNGFEGSNRLSNARLNPHVSDEAPRC